MFCGGVLLAVALLTLDGPAQARDGCGDDPFRAIVAPISPDVHWRCGFDTGR